MALQVSTSSATEVVDVTEEVSEEVEASGVDSGIGVASVTHTTAALVIQENETELSEDLMNVLDDLVPKGAGYLHDGSDGNAHSHLRAALLGGSVSFPVTDGRPVLGTWQRILLFEADGPRRRTVEVEVVG
ncbi:MAG: hypothetical protein MAG715_01132 [Methanonatronarchaeales archaeon]|nr:hypothetical protein [Methanonatronarchaeales archaeon]